MQKQFKKLFTIVVALVIVGSGSYLAIRTQRIQSTSRPTDQIPTVVKQDTNVVFVDSFLGISGPMAESFEAGVRSTVDGWDSLTIVPVGNADKLPTYSFVIDYRTRKSQNISDIHVLLQDSFKQPFVIEKSITVIGQSVQQFKSTGNGEVYRAIVFNLKGQDMMIISKARDTNTMNSYIGAYDAFLGGLKAGGKQ